MVKFALYLSHYVEIFKGGNTACIQILSCNSSLPNMLQLMLEGMADRYEHFLQSCVIVCLSQGLPFVKESEYSMTIRFAAATS